MKKQFVKDLIVGNKVDDVFFIRSRRQLKKHDGSKFLIIELSDRSGIILGKIWDGVDQFYAETTPGNFAKIQGDVTEYNGETQITILSINRVADQDVTPKDFIASSRFDLETMYVELIDYINAIPDSDYRKLLNNIFSSSDISQKFKMAPASTGIHHAYLGGLLEHTLFMLRLAQSVQYVYPEIDFSLLVAGIIVHDIGKIKEYNYDKAISHTDEGYLIGHIVIGYEIVKREIDKISDFPEDKKQLLLHIILSHHGLREFGSPTTPKFAEAYLVHALDNLDARLMMYREVTENVQGAKWSDYHQFLETKVFIRNPL